MQPGCGLTQDMFIYATLREIDPQPIEKYVILHQNELMKGYR